VKVQESKYGKTMGYYFFHSERSSVNPNKILSINTICEKGSFYRYNDGKLNLSEATNSAGIFLKYSIYKSYFISFSDFNNGFNGFLFSEKLSPCSYDCK
jgi:hypothetical protein